MLFRRRQKKSLWLNIKHAVQPQKGWKRVFLYILLRLKRLPGTPEFIAKAFAIGIAINFWPILFTHLLFGWIFCRIFRGDLIAMFIGTLFGNPWTFALVYPLNYKLGKVFLGRTPMHNTAAIDSAEEIWARLWQSHSWQDLSVVMQDILIPMMIGGFLLAVPCTVVSYYITRNAVRAYQTQRRRRLFRHFDDVEADIEHVPGNVE